MALFSGAEDSISADALGSFEITMIPLRFALLYFIAFLALLRYKAISMYVPFSFCVFPQSILNIPLAAHS